ncbi:MAG: putative PadR family transcriptional regulator [bacterium]|nr:MAG: putative PadR family transcriptional regulator [bacterium]
MTRSRTLSPAARRVLAALVQAGSCGRHGYDLCREAQIKSGTLYPLLIRLEAQGYLVADWQASEVPGRPPRHVYRLTAVGCHLAAAHPLAGAGDQALPQGRLA